MKRSIVAVIIFAFAISVSAQPPKNSFSANSRPTVEKLKKDVPALMKKADVPGLSAALIDGRKIVWKGSFGVGNIETGEAVTDRSVFEAASLTKPVVAYAVLKLVDQGKIDLDAPLNKYLGSNYDVGEDKRLDLITARRVLSHTSGFPNWRRNDSKVLPILFNPGEKFSYSGEGFVYLSKVVEKLTGENFEDFVQKNVFTPLGMRNSSLVYQDRFDKLKVYRHSFLGALTGRNQSKEFNAAASLQTTAEDYARFVIAVLEGRGLKKKTRQEMLTPQIRINPEKFPELGWGLGIGLETIGEETFVWHWGDNGDAKAFVIASEKSGKGIVFFANGSSGLSFVREMLRDSIGGHHQSIDWLDYERYDSPARLLLKEIIAKGASEPLKAYLENRSKNPASALDERAMNNLGYNLLRLKKTADAIEVFRQNTVDFPASANVWDSLAEAHMINGDKDLAIKFYEKTLQLNPDNPNAVETLKKLKGQ